jgi:UDP-N-acetylmuramoyl-tripeptide--D-alanyl-D-alanine ligase
MLHLPGEHNVDNLLARWRSPASCGVDFRTIARAPKTNGPSSPGRDPAGEVTVIKDCYNANPESMEKAIEFASSIPWPAEGLCFGSMKSLETGRRNFTQAGGDRGRLEI